MIALGQSEITRRGFTGVTQDELSEWAEDMTAALAPFEIGQIIVYLDGKYFALEEKGIEFDGYFAKHKRDELPHAKALHDPEFLEQALGRKEYWLDRELLDRE